MDKIKKWQTGDYKEDDPVFEHKERGDVSLWCFMPPVPGVKVVFTTRSGGTSKPPYESLNLGFHVDDLSENVKRNREIISSVLGIDPSRATSPRQRHTSLVELLDDGSRVGSGAMGEESYFDPCDGLVTSMRNAPILLHFADCAPVVLVGKGTGLRGVPAVAVLHAGRKGLIEGVVAAGAELMSRTYDIPPEMIIAAVGPAIGACCYQVGEEIAMEFEKRYGPDVIARNDEGIRLDMQSAAEAALLVAGIREQNIHVLEICTSCDDHFFSYRRDGVTGRHGAIAWIE